MMGPLSSAPKRVMWSAWLVVGILAGCGGQSGNEDTKPAPECEELTRESVPLDAIAEGFDVTPQEVVDVTLGPWSGTFLSASETSTGATLTLAHHGVATLVRRREVRDGPSAPDTGGASTSGNCPDAYELPADLRLTEASGLFDLGLDVSLLYHSTWADQAWFRMYVPPEELGGSASTPWGPAACDHVEVRLYLIWSPAEDDTASAQWSAEGDLMWICRHDGGRSESDWLGMFTLVADGEE
ncbi:MAG: hypothetical protein Q8P18_01365 [Pseudomonadota bacterium]|nr:hypothetical protein [Pseudomonadota bacterium]